MNKRFILWIALMAAGLPWLFHRAGRSASAQETPGVARLRLYVANKGAVHVACRDANSNVDAVSVIDPSQPSPLVATVPVGGSPQGIAVSPDGQLVYVANADDNSVSVLDATTDQTAGPPIAVGKSPKGLAVSPDGRRLYVANAADDTLSVINTTDRAVEQTVPVGRGPAGIAAGPSGNDLVYVS